MAEGNLELLISFTSRALGPWASTTTPSRGSVGGQPVLYQATHIPSSSTLLHRTPNPQSWPRLPPSQPFVADTFALAFLTLRTLAGLAWFSVPSWLKECGWSWQVLGLGQSSARLCCETLARKSPLQALPFPSRKSARRGTSLSSWLLTREK